MRAGSVDTDDFARSPITRSAKLATPPPSLDEQRKMSVRLSTRAKRLLGRALVPIVAALIAVLSFRYAGSDWFGELERWAQPAPRAEGSRHTARPGPIGAPITVRPMRPAGNDSSVSPVALPLILVRTQPGRNSREGFAQLGINGLSPQTYGAGALLANGTRLTEVYARYVVLERDGRSARLYLQGEPQADRGRESSLVTVGGTAVPAPVMSNSQESLTAYLRPSPVFVGDQLRGYALYPGRNPAPFSRLGLQPGDVLTRVNGVAVSTPADSLAALRTLADGAALTVVIERQGGPQTLSLDGAILAHAIPAEPSPATPPTPSGTPLQPFFKIDPSPLTRKPGL